jgi:hypothetical protein
MIARKRSVSGDEGGYILLIVMMFVVSSSFMLATGYELLRSIFAIEEASDRLPSNSDGIQHALGAALARLQTGEPTVDEFDRYACDLEMRDSGGDLVRFRLTYTRLMDNRWEVQAEPVMIAGTKCPATFTDQTCPASI